MKAFDETYRSRIDLVLKYDKLDRKSRRAIFQRLIDRTKAVGLETELFSNAHLDRLAGEDLNGREIEKLVTLALSLAGAKKESFGPGHLWQVMQIHGRFRRDLDQRSYYS